MKKILSVIFAIMLFCSVVPLSVFIVGAETATSGTIENSRWKVEGKVLTISGVGAIPDMPNDTPPWPDYVEKVVIEEGITRIGRAAFCGFNDLREVYIPKTVTSIGEIVFYYCENLSAVYIEDLTAWCNIDFADANSNPLFYGTMLVYNGNSVHHLIIPEGVKIIKKYAFLTIKYVNALTIPDSVEIIEEHAFTWSDLITADLGNSVHTIGEAAFYPCDNLLELSIPITLKNIGNDAFDCINEKANIWYGGWRELRNDLPYLKERDKNTYPSVVYNIATKATWHYETCRIHKPGDNEVCSVCGNTIKKDDLIQIGEEWHYYEDGVRSDETKLVEYKDKLFYVKNGVWSKKTTIIKYKGEHYFVNTGKVDFSFSGNKKIGGKTYKIKNGKVVVETRNTTTSKSNNTSNPTISKEPDKSHSHSDRENTEIEDLNENLSENTRNKSEKFEEEISYIPLIIIIIVVIVLCAGAVTCLFMRKRKPKE